MSAHLRNFFEACREQDLPEIDRIVANGTEDPNFSDMINKYWNCEMMLITAFGYACLKGNYDVVFRLLAIRCLDVNLGDSYEDSPLRLCIIGCSIRSNKPQQYDTLRLLLEDERVDTLKAGPNGDTPFMSCFYYCDQRACELFLASGRDLGSFEISDWAGEAVRKSMVAYAREPQAAREEAIKKVGWDPPKASKIFSMVIFISDGLLEIKPGEENAKRFFRIASNLHLDMQIILSLRCDRSRKDMMPSKEREGSFKELARKFR